MGVDCSVGVIKKMALASVLLGVSVNGFAGGFQLWEQSAAGTGNYHAGAAAIANDASTDFYNPAGMTRLKHAQISAGVVYIPTGLRFTGTVMSRSTGEVDGGTDSFLPNFHLVIPVGSRVAFGFSVTTPFGLTSDYSNAPQINGASNPIKDAATKTKLLTINLNPSVAFKINNHFSIGAGFNAQHASADFDNTIPGINSSDNNHLSAWGYGWNVGTLISFTPATRLGVSYRSMIDYKAKGTSSVANANPQLSGSSSITGELKIPATTTISMYHDVNQSLALMASVFYTQWDVMKEITLRGAPNPTSTNSKIDVTIPMNYHNSFNFAVGANYRVNQKMLLRFGAGYDQTPTNNTDRDVRIPGADKFALALGGHFNVSKHSVIDIGFTHFFIKTAHINNIGPKISQPGFPAIPSKGSVQSNVNVFGMQYSFIF